MTPISYHDAAELLGVALTTIQHNVGAGKPFTKVPSTSTKALLMREQVELFKGKSRVSLNSLSHDERVKWEGYATAISAPQAAPAPAFPLPPGLFQNSLIPSATSPDMQRAAALASNVGRAVYQTGGAPESEVPQGSNFIIALLIPR